MLPLDFRRKALLFQLKKRLPQEALAIGYGPAKPESGTDVGYFEGCAIRRQHHMPGQIAGRTRCIGHRKNLGLVMAGAALVGDFNFSISVVPVLAG
jgi:hypothetical protein